MVEMAEAFVAGFLQLFTSSTLLGSPCRSIFVCQRLCASPRKDIREGMRAGVLDKAGFFCFLGTWKKEAGSLFRSGIDFVFLFSSFCAFLFFLRSRRPGVIRA